MSEIIIHYSPSRGEYFFSTDHCQGVHAPDTYLPGFVPTSFYPPYKVVQRPTFPSGWVETQADVVKVYHADNREIPNPDPRYQP